MGNDIKINLDKVKYLQIGCGLEHFPQSQGWANLDISDNCKPDIQHDIRKGLPMFKDGTLETVTANGVLEMILPNEDFVFTMNEVHRVLKSDGKFSGQVPSTDPRVLMLDPFDRRWFMEETFNYWDISKDQYINFGKQYGFKAWIVDYAKVNDNGILLFEMRKPSI